MKKSIIYRGSFFALVFAAAWACSDSFLDKKPLGVYDQSALSNQAGTEAQLIATYHMLSGYNLDNVNTWAANPVNWVFGSIDTDDAYKGSESTDDPGGFTATETYNWSAGMINLSDKYIPSYEGVRRANSTITLLAASKDVNDADKARIRGEALFLRAWFHFELYKVFTNVPYYRENDYADYKKTNVGVDVVAECITDMTEAINLLPASQKDVGRVNQITAAAFLGKLYMFKNDYPNAKTQFAKVLAARSLNPCFKTVFTMNGENTPESIFSVQANINDNNQARNADWLNQLAYPVGPAGSFGCCGFHQPSQNLVNAFRVTAAGLPLNDNSSDQIPGPGDLVDPRLDLTVGRDGVPYYDWGVHAASWIRSRSYSGPYSPKKYMQYKSDPASNGGWNANATSAVNVQLIRLSDVMLMMAEADVETGDLPGATTLVNQVRTRAAGCAQGPATGANDVIITNLGGASAYAAYKVAPYPATFANADVAREAVRLERRLELALEGHRFFDLKRYTKMDPSFSPTDPNHFYMKKVLDNFTATESSRSNVVTNRPYLAGAAKIEEKHLSFPLPSNQVQLGLEGGKSTLVQNPGW